MCCHSFVIRRHAIDPQDIFPCPCCGYLVFHWKPGHHEVCPICGWEDDLAQLRFPTLSGSANPLSLEDAQRSYADFGACSRRTRGTTRAPLELDRRDRDWRPLDSSRDNVEEPRRGVGYRDSYPLNDTTVLYYWRPTYWRRMSS